MEKKFIHECGSVGRVEDVVVSVRIVIVSVRNLQSNGTGGGGGGGVESEDPLPHAEFVLS